MAEMWDIYSEKTDRWGYTRYSLVVHAPQELADKVMSFRDEIGMKDLTSEPHVSVTASLYLPIDLDHIEERVQETAALLRPFRLLFADSPVYHREYSGSLAVSPTAALLGLRTSIQQAIHGLIQQAEATSGEYRLHLTLYQGADEVVAAMARETCTYFDFGDGFDVASVELVGRVGPPRGGTRKVIKSFELALR